MSDQSSEFEDRLGRALDDGAADAPGPHGLADGARSRARRRRHRRVSAVAVAAVMAAVVPLALVGRGDDSSGAANAGGTTDAGPGWQTVSVDVESLREEGDEVHVLVDVPSSWVVLSDDEGSCGSYDYGEPSTGDCDQVDVMGVQADGGNLDYVFGPGLRPAADYDWPISADWIGHVELDEVHVNVASDDEQVALRVLGSARLAGETIPDLGAGWPAVVRDGVSYAAPPLDEAAGYGVRVGDRKKDDEYAYGEEVEPGRWRASATVGQHRIEVLAPTQALAELVAGSARLPEVAWHPVTAHGVSVEVPADWSMLDTSSCEDDVTRVGAADVDPCSWRETLSFNLDALYDTAASPGINPSDDTFGYVRIGDWALAVDAPDHETARRILASAIGPGETPQPLDAWRTLEQDGVRAEVPVGVAVDVEVLPGVVACKQERSAATPTADGRWRAGRCTDRVIRITGPTRAITDVVASSVRPG